jgi:hypothetical protein
VASGGVVGLPVTGWPAEQVLRGRTPQRRRAGSVLARHVALEAPHHHHGLERVLGACEVGRRGHGVSHGDRRDAQVAAERVGAPDPLVEGNESRRADGHIGLPEPPGAAEGVGDHERRPHPEGRLEAGPKARRRAVRILWQQHEFASLGGGVRLVDAGVGAHEAVVRHADQGAVHRPQ